MKKVYQNGTNLLKFHNGNSFANLHTRPKLGLLQKNIIIIILIDNNYETKLNTTQLITKP